MDKKLVCLMDFFVLGSANGWSEDQDENSVSNNVFCFNISKDQIQDNEKEQYYEDWEEDSFPIVPEEEIDIDKELYNEMFDVSSDDENYIENFVPKKEEIVVEDDMEILESIIKEDNEKIFYDNYLIENHEDIRSDFVHSIIDVDMVEKDDIKDVAFGEDFRKRIYEPPVLETNTRSCSWSERERLDIQGTDMKYPQYIMEPVPVRLFSKSEFGTIDIVDTTSPIFSALGKTFRKNNDNSNAMGYVRLGDLLMKLKSSFYLYRVKHKDKYQCVANVKFEKFVQESRGFNAYALLPHDRSYLCDMDFTRYSEYRISMDLDSDIMDRYKYFSKTRLTQYFLGGSIICEGDPHVDIVLVPKGKMVDWGAYPYLQIKKGGSFYASLDVGCPPLWNRQQKYDLVFRAHNVKIRAVGYIKFWFTHLFSGTKMWVPYLKQRGPASMFYSTGKECVINPYVNISRSFNSGFTSRGLDVRKGVSKVYKDFEKDLDYKKFTTIFCDGFLSEFVDVQEEYKFVDATNWWKFKRKYFPGFGGD